MSLSDTVQQQSRRGRSFTKPPQSQNPPPAGSLHDLSRALGIPVAVQRPLRYPFSSANKQINAPQRIAPALLQPFVEQRKPLLLVCPALPTLSAMLTAFDERALSATVPQADSLLPYTHQLLLVVFPVLPQQSYVLQTRIEAISDQRVILSYQDPRYEPRRQIPASVTLYLAPPSALAVMEHHQMHLTRELHWRAGEAEAAHAGELVDHLYDKQAAAQGAPVDFFGATPAWTGSVRDLSCGGVCLLLPQDQGQEALAEQCVWLHCSLPPVSLASRAERVTLTLHLLGEIRAVRVHQTTQVLHVRFLDRLPEAFGPLFAQMEGEAMNQSPPAG